ncbi:phage conserved hypothetical protein [Monaibacterium marinum]|uniref:Phage tail assembly chaperone protein, TAC n=1 Tax=Pontivivens marinum TaxID=1690039 RepID=A0A2C9CVS6_9RHOB|nr:rcc01693 family protein [Monaibacterium marinum]SOH94499.1 phage conserved hypothetical protein [Monaibacterium marinum]
MIDWPALMRLGLHGLRLTPDQFWALTPAELALMAGLDPQAAPAMARGRFDELSARYPDTKFSQMKGEWPDERQVE